MEVFLKFLQIFALNSEVGLFNKILRYLVYEYFYEVVHWNGDFEPAESRKFLKKICDIEQYIQVSLKLLHDFWVPYLDNHFFRIILKSGLVYLSDNSTSQTFLVDFFNLI